MPAELRNPKGRAIVRPHTTGVLYLVTTEFGSRKQLPTLQNGGMWVIHTGNPHPFEYVRADGNQKILIVDYFTEENRLSRMTRPCPPAV